MENKIKHLEFIQLTITRMNVNSFMIKGWLVTLVGAIFVLSEKDANTKFLWFPPFVTVLFWVMDAFFVSTERRYRSLYNYVRTLNEPQIDFSMDTSNYEGGRNGFLLSGLSTTLILFYPVVLTASIIAASYIK
ncbi:hypothetical protein [Filimonas lacunae]|nr:hypothetical protein [Filimonas lacunae]